MTDLKEDFTVKFTNYYEHDRLKYEKSKNTTIFYFYFFKQGGEN